MGETHDRVPPSKSFNVLMGDASDLPIPHVNVLDVRFSPDEFFLTFGIVVPPVLATEEEADALDVLTAQPVFRCAISRQIMQRFITIMSQQLDNQTVMLRDVINRAMAEEERASRRATEGEDD